MPTYKNKNSTTLMVNGVSFKFGVDTPINFYIDETAYPDLIKTSEDPIYTPVMFSKTVAAGASLNIEEYINKPETSSIRIMSTVDVSTVAFNKTDNPFATVTINTPLELKNAIYYKEIFVKSGSVNIEIWKSFNWRY